MACGVVFLAHSFRNTEKTEYVQRLIKILSTLGEVDECALCLADLKEKYAVHNHSVYSDRKKKLGTFRIFCLKYYRHVRYEKFSFCR